jgi:6-phosphogluconolactonase (cycloisomerase 2 family)
MGGGNISLYTINSDGSLSTNGNAVTADIYPASVTIFPNSLGTYAYAYVSNMGSSDITAFEISPSSGVFEIYVPGSNFTTGTYPNPVTIYPNLPGASAYFAYVSDRNDGNIWVYSINGTNGVLTNIQTMVTAGTSFTTVTIDPQKPYAYVSDVNIGLVYAFTIGDDGTLTLVPGSPF